MGHTRNITEEVDGGLLNLLLQLRIILEGKILRKKHFYTLE